MQIILASASPRRRTLLDQIGLKCTVVPSEVDEAFLQERIRSLSAPDQALALALAKAKEVGERHPGCYVLGADTLVTLDGVLLGKPKSTEEAATMLHTLAGRSHTVWTGVAIYSDLLAEPELLTEATHVRLRALSDRDIDAYVATGEPMDKAGAYGIQGRAAVFVESISGCYFNVVGLPLAKISSALSRLGCDIIAAWEHDS